MLGRDVLDVGRRAAESPAPTRHFGKAVVVFCAMVAIGLSGIGAHFLAPYTSWATLLQLAICVLPGGIILNHWAYLMFSRRVQFKEAVKGLAQANQLEELYFGRWPLAARYVMPALLLTAVSGTILDALTHPHVYIPWLFGPPAAVVDLKAWPTEGWARQALRGAILGFIGAYVYCLLLLVERARRRDVTTGVVLWAAAMPVVGPLTGGVTALLIESGVGGGVATSFSRDAVFLVAGMLPREVLGLIQNSVRRMFQMDAGMVTRTLPVTMLSSVGPDVETRLREEGIFDVATLAYASPYLLMRTTTYTARQIVDWIDEALLATTLPIHWEALQKLGVTGVMDLAWYDSLPEPKRTDAIRALAEDVKLDPGMLESAIVRLAADGQVRDIRVLYADGPAHSDSAHSS